MYELLREGVFYNRQVMFRQRTTRDELLNQHKAINTAIQERDPTAARGAVETHMDFVKASLQDSMIAERNEEIAKRRFEHELSRE